VLVPPVSSQTGASGPESPGMGSSFDQVAPVVIATLRCAAMQHRRCRSRHRPLIRCPPRRRRPLHRRSRRRRRRSPVVAAVVAVVVVSSPRVRRRPPSPSCRCLALEQTTCVTRLWGHIWGNAALGVPMVSQLGGRRPAAVLPSVVDASPRCRRLHWIVSSSSRRHRLR